MKCKIPEIAYHNKDPVLSVDFQPGSSSPCRLASGGADTHVVIWTTVVDDEGKVDLDCLCDLTRHQRAVNIVRWSPDGSLLASGDDESVIILWQQRENETGGGDLFGEETGVENAENWVVYKMLRFHLDDVYDLSWSPCSQFLFSGSVDNSAIITNVHKNQKVAHLAEAKSFVQGVAWNPKLPLLATHSSDRACRVYNSTTKKMIAKTYKASLNLPNQGKSKKKVEPKDAEKAAGDPEKAESVPTAAPEDKMVRLFHDDTFKGFFRRLAWSPDGELLLTPCGVVESETDSKITHCTYVFSRTDFSKPALCLPSKDKYTIAVRCCPIFFELRPVLRKKSTVPNSQEPLKPWEKYTTLFALPYRMVYAVATQNAVMFYDTQQAAPFGRVSNIHYTGLTDLSWSPDGRVVVVSSSDGFCSIITFGEDELGAVYTPPKADLTDTPVCKTAGAGAGATPVPTPTGARAEEEDKCLNVNQVNEEGVRSPAQIHIKSNKEGGKSNPKRLQFITLSSPKATKKKLVAREEVAEVEEQDDGGEGLGVELMDTEDLSLVLEESQMETIANKAVTETKEAKQGEKKRVPLVTLSNGTGSNNKDSAPAPASTPEKNKGRRVQLITLSSPKSKGKTTNS